ncbi:MAG TPA: AarF/UbiB family protein [Candidatus Binatia bacterium]|nr:AarF/UbiB family protein [Candidatus Binatia bacterium]
MTPASPDLAIGTFTDHGPWTIAGAPLPWRGPVEALRASAQRELPALTRPRWLPPLGRFLEAGTLIGGALLAWHFRERRRGGAESRRGLSRRLRRAFEHLGPAYIKLGQIVSSGQGIFPDELVEEFKLCRDQVPPEPFETVERVVVEDLGRPIADVFESFDRECLAAASIAQVHAARLRTGEDVVVKVQRPQVSRLVRRDIEAMAWIAPWLVGRIPVAGLANPPALVELFAETVIEELDFRLEADNMLDIARVLREAGQRVFVVPRPHPTLVTRRILVMERLRGFKYEDVAGMRAAGIDTAEVLRSMLIAFLEGAMIYGAFHGDLHGGNLFVMPDGRVALFDYGITGRMNEKQRLAFLRMMMTGAVNDVPGQIAAFRDLGALPEDVDIPALIRALKIDQPVRDPTKMAGDELVREVREILKALLAHGAKLPKNLMLYVKNMIFMDGALARYAPDVDLFAEFAKVYTYFALKHGPRIVSEIGFDPAQNAFDAAGMRAQLGLEDDVASLTHRQLQERRKLLQKRLEDAGGLPIPERD